MANRKAKSKEKRLLKEEKKQKMHDTVNSGIKQMYKVSIVEVKQDAGINVDAPLGLQHVSRFLSRLVAEYYLNGQEPAGKRGSPFYVGIPFHTILTYHDELVDQTIPSEHLFMPGSGQSHLKLRVIAAEMQQQMDTFFGLMAKVMYNKEIKYSKEGRARSNEEILRIVNEPDIAYYSSCLLNSHKHCFTLNGWQEFTEHLSKYFCLIGSFMRKDLETLQQAFGLQDPGAKKIKETDGRSRPMGSTSPESKDRSEYERLVQLSKERDKREAEERLAAQREKDAKIAAQREEAAREAERANQERQDAILRRLEKVNFHEAETLDAVAVAKAAETEREAREAKEKAIAESRARRREQKEKQRVKDEQEAKEHEKREHARETAKRIAHGEGYSKRKGNKA